MLCGMTAPASKKSPARRLRAILLVDGSRQALADQAAHLREIIERHLDVAASLDNFHDPFPDVAADLVVVFGGDGSILRSARQMGFKQLPVLGVNLGRLGFLAEIQPEDLDEILPQIVAGEYRVDREYIPQNRQLWFGAGRHLCLGGPLARAELSSIIELLLGDGRPFRVVSRRYGRRVLIPAYESLVVRKAR